MKLDITLDEALQRASKELRNKIEYSVNLLRKAEKIALSYDKIDGYYLAFSGGKDSQVLFHIAQLAGIKFKAHMNLTSIDPPEVIRFVKKEYPDVELIKPKKSIFQIAIEKKNIPTMKTRWCCKEFKENAGAGKVTLIGIRHEESIRRSKRNEIEISSRKYSGDLAGLDKYRQKKINRGVNIINAKEEKTLGCINGKESLLVSPIIHWTESDVWNFLNKVINVKHCCLYDEGFTRIGCIGCPMANSKSQIKQMERWPHVRRNWIRVLYQSELTRKFKFSEKIKETVKRQGIDLSRYTPKEDFSNLYDNISPADLFVAEKKFSWWTCKKNAHQWFAEEFLQLKLFKDDN